MDKKIKWESQHIDDDFEEIDEYEEEKYSEKPQEIMNTPIGMFKMNDKYNPYRQMEIWVGHCNFPISRSVFDIINSTLGVEFFKIITPYRFLVAPAQMFEWRDVRSRIEKNVCGGPSLESLLRDVINPEVKIQIKQTHEQISKFKYWAMYVLPNGRQDIYYSNEETPEYKNKVSLYKESKELSGGIFLSSET